MDGVCVALAGNLNLTNYTPRWKAPRKPRTITKCVQSHSSQHPGTLPCLGPLGNKMLDHPLSRHEVGT